MVMQKSSRVAIVGAGVAGLNCARHLSQCLVDVDVFDKGRLMGGRLASRVCDLQTFDYGAQYFTVRSDSFKQFLKRPIEDGRVCLWDARFAKWSGGNLIEDSHPTNRYVAVPHMSAFASLFADGLNLRLRHRVDRLVMEDSSWTVKGVSESDEGSSQFQCGGYDLVVLNMPPLQANELASGYEPLQSVLLHPCLAGMFSFDETLPLEADAILIEGSTLSWAARDSSKPGRSKSERWVIHGSPKWSAEMLNLDGPSVLDAMLETFSKVVSCKVPKPIFSKYHRWRYALPAEPLPVKYLLDEGRQLAVCGDWCAGARVEAAFISGEALASEILSRIT